MPQLPLFGEMQHLHPPVAPTAIARPTQPRSKRPKRPPQQPLLTPTAATAPSIPAPIAPAIDRPLPPASPPAEELPLGWVDPSDPAFNYLKNCRLCGALIKQGGLDHSLCSGECGYVIDLIWQARQQQRKRSNQPEPQAATHADSSETEALDLFSYGLDSTADLDGGAA